MGECGVSTLARPRYRTGLEESAVVSGVDCRPGRRSDRDTGFRRARATDQRGVAGAVVTRSYRAHPARRCRGDRPGRSSVRTPGDRRGDRIWRPRHRSSRGGPGYRNRKDLHPRWSGAGRRRWYRQHRAQPTGHRTQPASRASITTSTATSAAISNGMSEIAGVCSSSSPTAMPLARHSLLMRADAGCARSRSSPNTGDGDRSPRRQHPSSSALICWPSGDRQNSSIPLRH